MMEVKVHVENRVGIIEMIVWSRAVSDMLRGMVAEAASRTKDSLGSLQTRWMLQMGPEDDVEIDDMDVENRLPHGITSYTSHPVQ